MNAHSGWARPSRFHTGLLVWLLVIETATAFWFGWLEVAPTGAQAWRIQWPTNNPSLRLAALPAHVQQALCSDLAVSGSWVDDSQNRWLVNLVRWRHGRVSAHLARLHSPKACLPAAGWAVDPLPGSRRLGPLYRPLHFRVYRISHPHKPSGLLFYVCSGQQGDAEPEPDTPLTRGERLRAVWTPRVAEESTVLEIAVWGFADEQQAEAAVQDELSRMVVLLQNPSQR